MNKKKSNLWKGTLFMLLWIISVCVFAQNITVRGTVTDTKGEELIGVSIQVQGKTTGTVTDTNGYFLLNNIPSNSILNISYLGMISQTITLNGQTTLNIILKEDIETLDEVVVVGFGTQKKVNLTGAVSTVTSKQLESIPVRNTVLALQGQVPGLTIKQYSGELYGKNASMEMRGLNTIGQGSNGGVLVLIDGMEGDPYNINPQDIENISVLKDAAASSIYGSRAPFGVILITTKKGKQGRASINYNNSFRISSPINMPKMADSYSWALLFNDASNNRGYGDDISPSRLQRIKDYIDGKISYNTIPVGNQWATAYTEGNDNIDYYDVFWRDHTTAQEHNISINGGNEKVNYYISGNYLSESGLLNWNLDGLKRLNAIGKIDAKPFDFLTVSYSSRFIRENYHKPRVMTDERFMYYGQYLWPVSPLYDPNGILFNDQVLQFKEGGQQEISNTTSTHQFGVILEPIKSWRIVGDINFRYRSFFNQTVTLPVHQTSIDGITPGSVWDPTSFVSENTGRNDYLNFNVYTDFERIFADSHYIKAMVGLQTEEYTPREVWLSKAGVIVPNLPSINTSSGLSETGEQIPPDVAGSYGRWTTAGFFGRINYNYMEKYLFEANLRRDGSSRFRADKRWGWFPSFSFGYNIAKESFFEPATQYVNTLKLRASYGSLGNQNTSNWYPTYAAMGFANQSGTWLIDGKKTNIAWPPVLISSLLTWEKIRSWNIGLDFGMFNNRLTGDFNYFIRQTQDMVGPADELPVILGTNVPVTNNTNLESRGWELELQWRDQAFNNLNYSIRFVLSDAQAKITRYSNPSGSLSNYYTSKRWGEIWGFEAKGIARSNEEMAEHLATMTNGGQDRIGSNWQAGDVMYIDSNGDGKVDSGSWTIDDHGDLKVIGNTTPRYNFGIDLTAEWKGFDFRCFLQGVGKRDFFQKGKYFSGSAGYSKWGTMALVPHIDYFRDENTWSVQQGFHSVNINSYYPRPYFDDEKNWQTSSLYLQNAAYMRIKNLQIGYTLPKDIVSKAGISNLRLFVSGENLGTFTKMTSLFDPEIIGEGGNGEGNVYPLAKTWSAGLSITL